MKRLWISKIILFLTLLFFIFAFLLSGKYKFLQHKEVNVKQFEKILYEKESLTQNALKQLLQKVNLHLYTIENGIFFFKDFDYKKYSAEDIYFLIYQYDTLRYWTDNHLVVPDVIDNTFDLSISKIGVSWYKIKRIKSGSYDIVGLIKIKDEFPYSNKYLKDKFASGFGFIPGEVKISLIPVSYGFDIKDRSGDYLFSLVPVVSNSVSDGKKGLQVVLFIIAVWLFVLYLWLRLRDWSFIKLVFFSAGVLFLRLLMLILHYPAFLYDSDLFVPILGFYSLGDLFVDIPLFIFMIYAFYKKLNYSSLRPEKNYFTFDLIVLFLFNVFVISLLYLFYDLLYQLVLKADFNFELYKVSYFPLKSILILFYFGIIFIIIFLFYYRVLRSLLKYLNLWISLVIIVISALVVYAISFVISHYYGDGYKLLYLLLLLIIAILAYKGNENLRLFIFIDGLVAFMTIIIILSGLNSSIRQKLEYHASHLEYFRDNVAEQLLTNITAKFDKDDILQAYLEHKWSNNLKEKLLNYLYLEYLDGYLKKYAITFTICGSDTEFQGNDQYQVCADRYKTLLEREGVRISRYVYFINRMGELPGYIVYYPYGDKILILELHPSATANRIGYPDLLLKENTPGNTDLEYAVYKNGQLVYKTGDYIYPRTSDFWMQVYKNGRYIKWQGYKHFVNFDSDNDYLIVTSYKTVTLWDGIISFAYLFVFYVIITTVVFSLCSLCSDKRTFSFRTRILLFMIGVLTLSFLIFGATAAFISVQNYKNKFYQQIKQTLSRTRDAVEQLQSANLSPDDGYKLKYFVKNLASILDIDINLYDKSGRLMATSRQAVFENKLLGKRMSYRALEKLLNDKYLEFLDKEAIGSLSYNSAYTVVTDIDKKVYGFINIPYFANPQELRKEIVDMLVTLANLYIIMFLLTVVIAYFLSEQIIAPLRELQEKLKRLKVGHKYEKIDYKGKDEIGQLVEEYNNMVDKLEESVQLLAKSERESAWRDMAKQVAHEIKNPLTPMKLSIQLLQKAWENNDEDFGERLNEVTRTLIEQIENLRNIAEEFSNFAKMPKSENEKIDLAQKIENLVKLYENINNVEVKALIKARPVYIWADNKQISRAFINLIKNAIQAIPEGVKGKVVIELERKDDKALVKVIDNGTGIPEEVRGKLFTPSFTTKSSGMGLGLSMVKNIVQNARGKIWFDTQIGKGTVFYVEFPLYQQDKS